MPVRVFCGVRNRGRWRVREGRVDACVPPRSASGWACGPMHWRDHIRRAYPMALHGVSLSIGSIDPLDRAYLDELKALVGRVQPMWGSDHLCFTGLRGQNMHDLLPLPYTEEALDHTAERVLAVQDHLGQRLVLENVSSYVTYAASELTEWEFIAELAKRADCDILLDVNNVYVSAFND